MRLRPSSSFVSGSARCRGAVAGALLLLLAACGGGGGGDSVTAPSAGAPAGATATTSPDAVDALAADRATADGSSERSKVAPAGRGDAARFLAQASFGATPAEIDRVLAIGYAAWIDEQFARPATGHRAAWDAADAAIKAADPSRSAGQNEVLWSFWRAAAIGDDALRQKLAFALSQIFVVSLQDSRVATYPRGVAGYLDTLAEKGFGNYRDLLEAVTRHPMMGLYLSHLRNQKEDARTGRIPDQNYAREVMQLFSIGLHRLDADGTVQQGAAGPLETYTADDVVGLARVFTGFSWYGPDLQNGRFAGNTGLQDADRTWKPMQGYPQYHSLLEKRFLGATVPAQTAANPDASLKAALDTLFAHPNVGPFIGRQLIQRLVTSNPSPAYVARVAAAFAGGKAGARGDMKAVVKAVLLDPEARQVPKLPDDRFGKVREPVLRLANLLRTFRATSDSGAYRIGTTDDPGSQLGQTVLRAPSVFNFYRPGYVAPNTATAAAGLVAPELQITNETTTAGYVNFMRDAIARGVGAYDATRARNDVQLDVSGLLPLAADGPALVARLGELLVGGRMPADLAALIAQGVASVPIPALNAGGTNQAAVDTALRTRVNAAIFLTMVSPEYIVQK